MASQKNEQVPMSLENLPAYLKSNRKEHDSQDCVVDMGRISPPNSGFNKWSQQVILSLAVCVSMLGVGVITYKATTTQEITVILDVNNQTDARSIAKMVNDNGGQILAVKQTEESTYEVKVSTRKSLKSFMEWLNQNKNFNKVVLKDD